MQVTGIIAEFNPFHVGHTVPITAAREAMDGVGAVVCIMSGNCVQRGDLAIFHKRARAEAAIHAGADLVVELPAPYVLGSAERFAGGAVALLAAMGQSDTRLAFGCETADAAALTAAARALDSPEVQAEIKSGMKGGLAYGAACQTALDTQSPFIGSSGTLVLQTPNNLLGIEYLRAIHRLGVDIAPLPVARQGAAHDSETPVEGYASATHIRRLLQSPFIEGVAEGRGGRPPTGHGTPRASSPTTDDTPWSFLPRPAADIFLREIAEGRGPASLAQLEATVLTLLRLREPPAAGYLDDSEGLAARITNIAAQVGGFSELLEQAKTKRYHLSRIRRLILTMCLGLMPANRPALPPYIRVLATNQTGQALLRCVAKTGSLPIVSRPGEVKKLGAVAAEMMARETAVTDLQALCFRGAARAGGSEWRTAPYVVE